MKKGKTKCVLCEVYGNTNCPICKGKGYVVVKKTNETYIEL